MPELKRHQLQYLQNKIFPDGYASLQDLSLALQVNVIEQMRSLRLRGKLQTARNILDSQHQFVGEAAENSGPQRPKFKPIDRKPTILAISEAEIQEQQQQQITVFNVGTSIEAKPPQHEHLPSVEKKSQDEIPQISIKKEPEPLQLTLDEQIDEFFDKVDENHNGFLESKEIQKALLKFGINPTPQEIMYFFDMFHKSYDEKITRIEFNVIIMDQIMRHFLCSDGLISQLKTEFRLLTDTNYNELDALQVQCVFKKLGVQLSNQEVIYLFSILDLDQSGYVEMNEFITFLKRPFSQQDKQTQKLLIKMTKKESFTLKSMTDLFEGVPNNYSYSFICDLKTTNLNSQIFSPQLDEAALNYKDLPLINAQYFDLQKPLIDKSQFDAKFQYEIKILSSGGIPSIDEKSKLRILLREAAVCLFDGVTNKFVGNVVIVPCLYNRTEEDKWMFVPDYPFIISQQNSDSQLILIIELVAHAHIGDGLSSLSVSYGQIPLSSITKPIKMDLVLQGGSPLNPISVDPANVKSKGGFMKKQFTQPTLTIQIIKINEVLNIPTNCMIPRKWITLIDLFRQFIAYKSISKGSFCDSLPDYSMQAFLSALDIPTLGDKLADWWTNRAKKLEFPIQITLFQQMCQAIYIMIQNTDFKFKNYPASQRLYHNQDLQGKREMAFREMFIEITSYLMGGQSKRSESYFKMEPLILSELDVYEDRNLMKLKKI